MKIFARSRCLFVKFAVVSICLQTLVYCVNAAAATAVDLPYVIVEPDGTRLFARDKGSEWQNWTETLQGYVIAAGDDGFWYYVQGYDDGETLLSETRAIEPPPLTIQPSVIPNAHFPDSGGAVAGTFAMLGEAAAENSISSTPVLMILVEFDDRKAVTEENDWASVLTEKISDYYRQTSHGHVLLGPGSEWFGRPNDGVIGWLNIGYAHPNTGTETGEPNVLLAKDAILAADPFIDYASYDVNGDGYVDVSELAIMIVAAGYERAYSGAFQPSLWAHQWAIGCCVVADGVIVGQDRFGAGGYAQIGELHRSDFYNEHQATVGIMVHELGHLIFNLPDLYDIDGSSAGIGAFGVMGYGSWGKSETDDYIGETPVMASAWTKYSRGWSSGEEGQGETTLVASGDQRATSSNTVYRASTALNHEFFLFENRYPAGYDLGLQRWLGKDFGGMAIWHIDDNQTNNAQDDTRWVDLESAQNDDMVFSKGQAGDLFAQGEWGNTVFDRHSTPNSRLYSGSDSGVKVSEISAPAPVMTAEFSKKLTISRLRNRKTVSGISGVADSLHYFRYKIYTQGRGLQFVMNGGEGDADLYVKFGEAPTLSSYDCRPYLEGANEVCSFASPDVGSYYILIHGFSAIEDVSLTVNRFRSSTVNP